MDSIDMPMKLPFIVYRMMRLTSLVVTRTPIVMATNIIAFLGLFCAFTLIVTMVTTPAEVIEGDHIPLVPDAVGTPARACTR